MLDFIIPNNLNLNLTTSGDPAIVAKLDLILSKLETLRMNLDTLQAAVASENEVIASAITLINGLGAQIAALQPTQEAIDALAADVTARAASLASAVSANTPSA